MSLRAGSMKYFVYGLEILYFSLLFIYISGLFIVIYYLMFITSQFFKFFHEVSLHMKKYLLYIFLTETNCFEKDDYKLWEMKMP